MNYLDKILSELSSRLPELEWKISSLNSSFSSHSLPRGLFRASMELTGSACVAEIKSDIQALSGQKNERSASYLAVRIQQKINVLVALCQIHSRKNKSEEKVYFGLKMLSTRQQWIQTLETDINTLSIQHQAMAKALEQMKHSANGSAILSLQSELGEVERRLTLAKEALNHAVS